MTKLSIKINRFIILTTAVKILHLFPSSSFFYFQNIFSREMNLIFDKNFKDTLCIGFLQSTANSWLLTVCITQSTMVLNFMIGQKDSIVIIALLTGCSKSTQKSQLTVSLSGSKLHLKWITVSRTFFSFGTTCSQVPSMDQNWFILVIFTGHKIVKKFSFLL